MAAFTQALREIIQFVDSLAIKFRLLHKFHWSIRVFMYSLLNLYIYFVLDKFDYLHRRYEIERRQYISQVASLRTSEAKRKLKKRRIRLEG